MPQQERDVDGRGGIALVLGGGAPNLTLMSGALAALDEKGVKFDVISALGAGMLVGLLYAAPKGGDRQKALAMTRDLGVEDTIYNLVPVNYKVFHKSGPTAELYTRLFQQMMPWLPFGGPPPPHPHVDRDRPLRVFSNLVNDWIQLILSTLCPWNLNPWSLGLCQSAPWIEEAVDFQALSKYDGKFFISAYCVDDQRMQMFSKEEIVDRGPSVFRACLAMPFIYEPFTLDGKTYIEGAAYDTFNFKDLFATLKPAPDILVVSDIIGREELLRKPRHLLDAYALQIIVPLVAMARDDLKLLCLEHMEKYPNTTLLRLKYNISPDDVPYVLDWSRANLESLYDVGRQAGYDLYEQYGDELCKRAAVGSKRHPSTRADILRRYEHNNWFVELDSYRSGAAWIPRALVWPQGRADKNIPLPAFAEAPRETREAADEEALARAKAWIDENARRDAKDMIDKVA